MMEKYGVDTSTMKPTLDQLKKMASLSHIVCEDYNVPETFKDAEELIGRMEKKAMEVKDGE